MCESPPRPPSALPDRLVKSPTFVSEKTYKACSSKRPSTSRTYLSSLSNHVDIKISDPGVKARPEKSSLMDMEPAFVNVRKDVPGLSVWRLEVNIHPVYCNDKHLNCRRKNTFIHCVQIICFLYESSKHFI